MSVDPTPTPDGGATPKPNEPAGPRTFTQEEVNTLLAAQKREFRDKFADYDDLKASADKWAEIEEQQKSDTQKAIERAEAAEKKAAGLEAEKLLSDVAGETGLSLAQVKRLTGATKDELLADAEEFKQLLKPATSQKPIEDLKGGSSPDEPVEPDVKEIVKSIPRF